MTKRRMYGAGMQKVLILLIIMSVLASPAFALSYEEERKVAGEVIDLLEAQGAIVHDADVTWVLQSLTDQIAAHVKDPVYNCKIYVLKDRSINAMAIPDGNIFINVGTILFAKDIDEIASVIGHEMGHCQLRHLPESMKAQSQITAASFVGVLAGLLLSAANPQVGSALVMSSLGGAENLKLQYTRKQELEADEFGRNILEASGMDPTASARFLIRLRTYADSTTAPQYFLTHPYTQDRIAALERDPLPPHADARFWTLFAIVLGELFSEDETRKRAAGIPGPYDKLALGIVEVRLGKNKEGLGLLDGIDLPIARAWKGLALYGLGEKAAAYPLLCEYRRNAQIAIALADIMVGQGRVDEAIATLTPFQDQNPRVAYTLGVLFEKKGQAGLSHAAFARYFFAVQDYKSSMYHIKKALEDQTLDKDVADSLKRMQAALAKGPKT